MDRLSELKRMHQERALELAEACKTALLHLENTWLVGREEQMHALSALLRALLRRGDELVRQYNQRRNYDSE